MTLSHMGRKWKMNHSTDLFLSLPIPTLWKVVSWKMLDELTTLILMISPFSLGWWFRQRISNTISQHRKDDDFKMNSWVLYTLTLLKRSRNSQRTKPFNICLKILFIHADLKNSLSEIRHLVSILSCLDSEQVPFYNFGNIKFLTINFLLKLHLL